MSDFVPPGSRGRGRAGGAGGLAPLLGAAGLVPFLACGLGAVSLRPGPAALCLGALIAYGSVILAFLGGVHWGFALMADRANPADRLRLLLGVVPSLIGWAALLLAPSLGAEAALAMLIAGFVATIAAEQQGAATTPAGYLWLRWTLSLIVLAVLITVLVVRLIGARIVL